MQFCQDDNNDERARNHGRGFSHYVYERRACHIVYLTFTGILLPCMIYRNEYCYKHARNLGSGCWGGIFYIYRGITSRFDTPNVGALHRSRRAARRDAADMTIYF